MMMMNDDGLLALLSSFSPSSLDGPVKEIVACSVNCVAIDCRNVIDDGRERQK